MPQCWSCQKVKGKRPCPARAGELICSRCCGTKRRVEIRCPDDCRYLHGAHDPKWQSESRQKEEARILAHFLRLPERQAVFLFFVHHLLLTSTSTSSLGDDELADVLETTLKTLETRAKGLVYSHPSRSPELQPTADWLTKILSEREKLNALPDLSNEDALATLGALLRAVGAHRDEGSGRESYLQLAARVFSDSLADAPPIDLPEELDEPPPSLIVPP